MTAAAQIGRRDRKKLETRDLLRREALRLALEVGYEQLTVQAITEAADVSVRTFFNYFASKDDALLGADPEQVALLVAALVARPSAEPPLAALRAVFGELVESFAADEQLWQTRMLLLHRTPQLWPVMFAGFTAFERSVAEAVAARSGTDPDVDLYPGVVAAASVGAIRVAVAHWRAAGAGPGSPLSELLSDAFDVLGAGLTVPRARRRSR